MKKIRVYYDAACPRCRRDRRWFERLAGKDSVDWCDITGKETYLREHGINPDEALIKLQVQQPNGEITQDIEAYILLLSQVRGLKPLARLLNKPIIREPLRRLYRKSVYRRLQKENRLP